MLAMRGIKPIQSEWAAAIVFVQKKEGSLWYRADNQNQNAATIQDSYSVPLMEKCIELLRTAPIFWTLDVHSENGKWKYLNHIDRHPLLHLIMDFTGSYLDHLDFAMP